ncbi:hypothetical protein LIER_02595 [Lithospermum erythrorhizon]|uniref:Uncharacterized protein n=1 Tax=Lithospermum erythrorhizon TaxID=34254 RepID=A0AAV3NR62_LITER
MVVPNPSSFFPDMDLPHEPSSSSFAGKRPLDEVVLQGNEKRARGTSELFDPPKDGIPPPPFPASDPLMVAGFFNPEFLTPPYTLLGSQQICVDTPFKSNLQSFHAVRPLLLEGLCERYSNALDPLKVYGDMCRYLIQVANVGFELARRADCLGEENKDLKAQDPSAKVTSLEEELAKVKAELAGSHRINVLLNNEKKKLMEDYLGLQKRHEDATSKLDKLKAESSGFDVQITQLSRYKDAAVAEAYRTIQEQSTEFESALSAAVERFKKSSEFLDALGANAAYGVCSFVRKYKEKYPDLHADYIEFQEGYNSSWFAELSLDAPSDDEEDENEAPPTS